MVLAYKGALENLRQSVDPLQEREQPKQTTRGLLERPRSSQRLSQQTLQTQVQGPTRDFESYVKELEAIRKRVKAVSAKTEVKAPTSAVEINTDKVIKENLGVKQQKSSEEVFTIGRQVDQLAARSVAVNLTMPKDVSQDKPFMSEVARVSNKYGLKPNDLLALIEFETDGTFDPSVRNKQAGQSATGLIQFVESTARGLGTSTEALSKMDRAQQMAYVDKYLEPYADRIKTREDLYMAVIWPAAIGKPRDHVMFKQGSIQYEKNSGLDLNKDGSITKQEAAKRAFS